MATILQGYHALTTGPIQAGPLVGEVGPTDAWVWAQARSEGVLTCLVVGTTISVGIGAWAPYGIVRFHLTGLHPDTEYSFQIVSSTEPGLATGVLRTAPADTARRCKIAFGSCYHAYWVANQPIFDAILNEDPNVFVLAGDSIYFASSPNAVTNLPATGADWDSETTMILAHLRSRNNPELRNLQSLLSTLAVWDDHDYGPNNSDGSFANKPASLAAFGQMWANRGFGVPGVPGVFSRVRCGPAELFLLDDRYNRVEAGKPNPQILGAAQLGWLQGALSASTAPIKLIISGSVVLPEFIGQPSTPGYEGWRTGAAAERSALLAYIEAHNITGVVFLSGDLHAGFLYHRPGTALSGGRRGPEYWEMISSPLANDIWPEPIVDTAIASSFYDPGVYEEIRTRNYGLVDIDLDRAGEELALSLRSETGASQFTVTIGIGSLATRVPTPRLRAITWVGGKAYFFKGDRYVRYTVGNVGSVQHIDPGYPANIAGNWQDFDRVDAGFVTGDKAYLFSGNGYLRMSPGGDPDGNAGTWTEDAGYPAYIQHVWTGFFRFNFDAAIVWPTNNMLYVFRGTQYVRCAATDHAAIDSAPRPILGNWPGLGEAFPDGIDAAVVWSPTTAYFFKGDQYVRYNVGPTNEGVLAGYPKSISGAWPDLAAL